MDDKKKSFSNSTFDSENPPNSRVIIKTKQKSNGKSFFIFILFVFLFASLFGTYYFYNKYNQLKKNPDIISQKEVDNTLASVEKLMVLPSDETPSMATVLDKNKLEGQDFFVGVENGDKLLIFSKSMQAIIYRPSSNKIIKVGPIFINETNQEEISQNGNIENVEPVVEENINNLKIAYYNGTSIPNLSAQTESAIKLKYPNYQTSLLANASNSDYKKTIVVDLSGLHAVEANEISQLVGASVQILPELEIKPDADILIISGQ
jgi:hypothetical protein